MPSSVERPTEPSGVAHQRHTQLAARPATPSVEVELSVSADPDDWLATAFRRDYGPLVRLATLLVDREVAEELVQDAFVRTHSRLSRIAPEKVTLYLRSAVINGARSHLRRRMVQRRHLPPPPPLAVAAEVDGVAAAERTEMLAALERLPNRQREVLVLRYYIDLSENEIAETLGISTGSVKQHAHRGLATMHAHMQGKGQGPR
jgi:RNA polymerase sigma-70 factor (sigma-E family)